MRRNASRLLVIMMCAVVPVHAADDPKQRKDLAAVIALQGLPCGEVVGYVGSTGRSTSPHLHYEVIRNDEKVNPINYFFNDLTADEYDRMIELSMRPGQSFD